MGLDVRDGGQDIPIVYRWVRCLAQMLNIEKSRFSKKRRASTPYFRMAIAAVFRTQKTKSRPTRIDDASHVLDRRSG